MILFLIHGYKKNKILQDNLQVGQNKLGLILNLDLCTWYIYRCKFIACLSWISCVTYIHWVCMPDMKMNKNMIQSLLDLPNPAPLPPGGHRGLPHHFILVVVVPQLFYIVFFWINNNCENLQKQKQ